MNYPREIFRIIKGNRCEAEGCSKKWKKGMRKFDVHHMEECGKRSRKYDTLDYLLKNAKLFCHKHHFKHPLHTQQREKHFVSTFSGYQSFRLVAIRI